MKREIKFRAWNSKAKRMVDPHKTTPLALHPEVKLDGVFLPFHEDYILMQSTNLHDRKGKEIYEGDIVEEGHIYHRRYEVKWNMNGYWEPLTSGDSCGCCSGAIIPSSSTVVGNVYENPEVLNKR